MEPKDLALKERIIAEAGRQFLKYGFRKTTMGEVATGLKLSKKTLYRFFTNKRELFKQTALFHLNQIEKQFALILKNRNMDFGETLVQAMQVLATKIKEVGNFLREELIYEPGLLKGILEQRERIIISFFRSLFRQGRRKGYIRKTLKEEIFLTILLTILQSLFEPTKLAELPFSSVELFNQVVQIMLFGLLSSKGQAELNLTGFKEFRLI